MDLTRCKNRADETGLGDLDDALALELGHAGTQIVKSEAPTGALTT
jgi:hypothetical protein